MKLIKEIKNGWAIKQLKPQDNLTIAQLEEMEKDETANGDWYAAEMPAQVHEILVAQNVLKDPALLHGDATGCLWVAECDWVYRCSFLVEERRGRFFLHFKGLDTLADVYLNGVRIASACNMFVPLRVEVTKGLREENLLLIHFHSPTNYQEKFVPTCPEEAEIPAIKTLRKANHDYGIARVHTVGRCRLVCLSPFKVILAEER